MTSLPKTIYNPEVFTQSPAAGFDGVFDWSWTDGCLGKGLIKPMDFDGVIERKGNFLIFETKKVGVPVPTGQLITLESIYSLECFTVIFIHGKEKPEAVSVWPAPDFRGGKPMDASVSVSVQQARNIVSEWYDYANKNPKRGNVKRWTSITPECAEDDHLVSF